MRNPELGAEDSRWADAVFPPPDSVVFEAVAGELRQSTDSPEWLDRLKPAGGSAASVMDYLPYLESFLPEARAFGTKATMASWYRISGPKPMRLEARSTCWLVPWRLTDSG